MYRTPARSRRLPVWLQLASNRHWGSCCWSGSICLATQYIAAQFRLPARAGNSRLCGPSRAAVYQPFAWCIWGFQNCTSRDDQGPQAALRGRNDRAGRLHSLDARFLRRRQQAGAAAYRRMRKTCMARLAGRRRRTSKRPGSCAAEAESTSAAGTTTRPAGCNISPQRAGACSGVCANPVRQRRRARDSDVAGLGGSAVIYDIKGENWAKTAGFRAQQRSSVLQVLAGRGGEQSPASIRWPKFGCSLRAMSPTRRTSPT